MIANKLLRSIFRRHVLRSELWIKVNRDFNLIEWHIQKELVQGWHHSCLRSFMSFIGFQLFNVLKFTPNHLISTTLHQVRLLLQSWHTGNSFTKLCTKVSALMLNLGPLSFRNHKVTLLRSVSGALGTFGRLWSHTTGQGSRNTLLTRSHCFGWQCQAAR